MWNEENQLLDGSRLFGIYMKKHGEKNFNLSIRIYIKTNRK